MKRIIVDFDKTLFEIENNDFKNPKFVNIKLIQKLNELHDLGYEIIVETARGCISKKGDRAAADEFYREKIEELLKTHNLKYTALSFNKKLAEFYIDDKAITPKKFEKFKIKKLNGLSGEEVIQIGNKIYKYHKNINVVLPWIELNKKYKLNRFPKIYDIIHNLIIMEKIDDIKNVILDEMFYKTINYKINLYKSIPHNKNFDTYYNRVYEKVPENEKEQFLKLVKSIEKYMNEHKSVNHGDLTRDNILIDKKNVYFIDPIMYMNEYQSYLLDISKFTMYEKYKDKNPEFFYKEYDERIIKILELTHCYRVIYNLNKLNNDDVTKFIEIKNNLLKELT